MKKKKTLFADILGTLTKYFIILVIVVDSGSFGSTSEEHCTSKCEYE